MDVLIPLAPFLMVAAIVGFVMWSNVAKKRAVMETVKEALRSGQELSPETIEALGAQDKEPSNGSGDLKGGLILIAVAVSLVILGVAMAPTVAMEEPDAPNLVLVMSAVASFPGLIGVVLVIFGAGKLMFSGRGKKS